MIYVGIDPGIKGGIAAIMEDGRWLWAVPIPLLANNSMDAIAIHRLLTKLGNPIICIERAQSAPGQGIASTFKYGVGYGNLIAIATLVSSSRPTLVQSPIWKKEVLVGYTHDKAGAIKFCRDNFPGLNLIRPGCRTPCDGMADATCIAEYARRRFSF